MSPRNDPPEVATARIQARTARTVVRWNSLSQTVRAVAAAASTIFAADQVTDSGSAVNWWLVVVIVVLAAALAACGGKIRWDQRQKVRQREQITQLEEANRKLVEEKGELRGQVAVLRQPGEGGSR